MGKGGSSSPPDYSAEKSQIRTDTENKYQTQADAYNQSIGEYNTQLGGFSNQLGNLSSNIGGLSYKDLYDDPTTAENENPFGTYQTQLKDIQTGLGGLTMDAQKPTFKSALNTDYGTVGIQNIPELMKANTNQYNTATMDVSNLMTNLNNLNRQREDEVRRIEDYRGRGLQDLAGYSTQLGQMGIGDLSQMNQMERDLSGLKAGADTFQSPIMDQLYPDGLSQFNTQYTNLTSGLQDLRNRRQTELDRISNYESGILTDVDAYRDRLGDITIADENAIDTLLSDITNRQRGVGRFASDLGFDLSQEGGELSDVYRDVSNLQNERQRELDRIRSAEQNFLGNARGLEQSAEGGSIYSGAGINRLEDRLRDLEGDIAGFSSVLPSDFSRATGSITDAETAIASLNERRKTELDNILAQVTGASGSNLTDLKAYDEAGMGNLQSALRDAGYDLSQFSGGRVNDIQTQLSNATSAIDTRLQELSTARTQLETRAQELLQQINNANFYASNDLTGSQTQFDALNAEVELYNAQEALDEIQQVENKLNSERNRLTTDEGNVAARLAQERADVASAIGPSGVMEFNNIARNQVDPMSLEQYLNLLRSQEEEDPTQTLPSAFAQNVIRA
ncbi:MAG: hypothetical protein CL557_12440 [Alphaproteobacteria bacterium]|nr:hypothetical protein [Alphaproteobacteria bacterium]|tara:strand:- start:4778 stop:6640 length:1863 start_codon:yes stop_codon:yes gene_type:complete